MTDEIKRDERGRLLPGSPLYKLRKPGTFGGQPIFETPDELWQKCQAYFEWAADNPIQEEKVFQYEGEPIHTEVTKMRAVTKSGLYVFLGINRQTWVNYKNRDAFRDVCEAVEDIMYDQKFGGAAAGVLNASIIARELGLKEQTTNEHTGADGAPLSVSVVNYGGNNDPE